MTVGFSCSYCSVWWVGGFGWFYGWCLVCIRFRLRFVFVVVFYLVDFAGGLGRIGGFAGLSLFAWWCALALLFALGCCRFCFGCSGLRFLVWVFMISILCLR